MLSSCNQRTLYFEDGSRRSSGSASRTSGLEEGTWSTWYPNGERRESGEFRAGQRVGIWTQWYPDGQRRSRGERVWQPAHHASPRSGSWTFWHVNGEVLAHGVYRDGQREGHWDYSLEDGTLDGDHTGEYHDDRKLD